MKSLKLKAERIYEIELNNMIKLVGNKTTYSDQLLIIGKKLFKNKFMGIFTSDKIPKNIKIGYMIIVNLDSSGQSGSHWVAVCKDKKGTIWVYDSFGRSIHKILPDIYNKRRKIKSTERDLEQDIEESNCGARCLAFLQVFHKYGSDYAKWI